MSITCIEDLEALATAVEATENDQRTKLLRMIRAYIRILAIREPQLFKSRPTVYADEDGHYDNSYPPKQEWKQKTGPKTILIRRLNFESRATSGGFYHTLQYYTTSPGLHIDQRGNWRTSELTGTGEIGQYAAHPGECEVDCTIEYSTVLDEDVPTDVLVAAEQQLRGLAFPASLQVV